MSREFLDSIDDALDAIQKARSFTAGMTFRTFSRDTKTVWATLRAIEVIGEAAKNVPASIRRRYPQIAWADVIAMRNKLAHEYFGVDLRTVWATVRQDLPPLERQFARIRADHAEKP